MNLLHFSPFWGIQPDITSSKIKVAGPNDTENSWRIVAEVRKGAESSADLIAIATLTLMNPQNLKTVIWVNPGDEASKGEDITHHRMFRLYFMQSQSLSVQFYAGTNNDSYLNRSDVCEKNLCRNNYLWYQIINCTPPGA